MKNRLALILLFIVSFLLATEATYAASKTATLYVKATVVPSVVVSCTPLIFPSFDKTTPGIQLQGEGQVLVNSTVPYQISLDAGRYFNGSMRCLDSGKKLAYKLYQDSARSIEWGDSDFAGSYMGGKSKKGTVGNTTHTVYGILTTASVDEGDYQDSVIITVIY